VAPTPESKGLSIITESKKAGKWGREVGTSIQFRKLLILVDDSLDTIHFAPFKDILNDPAYIISIGQLVLGDQGGDISRFPFRRVRMNGSSPGRQTSQKPRNRSVQCCEMKAFGDGVLEEGGYEVACYD
jgi:hypothetical protein